ncbi:hypothetical protein chiPu_0015623 [Chiloscyllium punctatum]|uniref:Uncharacterized protein n=1 Tax=Chiloscyllium punctatum TaxID=137246 RepID=A0A401T3A1_CHIPU|nr:hypothetical protein [Chiloscyllium punctatum]
MVSRELSVKNHAQNGTEVQLQSGIPLAGRRDINPIGSPGAFRNVLYILQGNERPVAHPTRHKKPLRFRRRRTVHSAPFPAGLRIVGVRLQLRRRPRSGAAERGREVGKGREREKWGEVWWEEGSSNNNPYNNNRHPPQPAPTDEREGKGPGKQLAPDQGDRGKEQLKQSRLRTIKIAHGFEQGACLSAVYEQPPEPGGTEPRHFGYYSMQFRMHVSDCANYWSGWEEPP